MVLTVRMDTEDSGGNATSMPGFLLARGSVWAGGRDHTPSRVPQRWGTTSCREAELHLPTPTLSPRRLCYQQ
jgi:hypothetical protein